VKERKEKCKRRIEKEGRLMVKRNINKDMVVQAESEINRLSGIRKEILGMRAKRN